MTPKQPRQAPGLRDAPASEKELDLARKKSAVRLWGTQLRDQMCRTVLELEHEATLKQMPAAIDGPTEARFERQTWKPGSPQTEGGGEMSLLYGRLFEKIGVNISCVWGRLPEAVRQETGLAGDGGFWATGLSLVAHFRSPHLPALHLNTRYFTGGAEGKETQTNTPANTPADTPDWFGGVCDMNPSHPCEEQTQWFHEHLRSVCAASHPRSYQTFKENCDSYFYMPHRGKTRGVGGIFFDRLRSDVWEKDFRLVRNVGLGFLHFLPMLVRSQWHKKWTPQDRKEQLRYRGHYAEFNLLYDRGTRFGLRTGGATAAIFMALPPQATWTDPAVPETHETHEAHET